MQDRFPHPYVCSLSPMLRAAVKYMGKQAELERVAEGIVTDIVTNEEVAVSLKVPTLVPGAHTLRQVDIRPHEGSDVCLLKCYIRWDEDNVRWHVFMEGSKEDNFTKGIVNSG